MKKLLASFLLIFLMTSGLTACANRTNGTLLGAGVGGLAGGVLTNGSPLGIIGGAAAGGLIGNAASK